MRAGSASVAPASISCARAFGAMQRFELGELHAVVDAEHFGEPRRDQRRDLDACSLTAIAITSVR